MDGMQRVHYERAGIHVLFSEFMGWESSMWITGLALTMIDMLRDLHVQQRGLSWVVMPSSQRRLVYLDIVTRIEANMPPRTGERQLSTDDIAEILMLRDEKLTPLGDSASVKQTP